MNHFILLFLISLGFSVQNETIPIITLRMQDKAIQDKNGNFVVSVEAISNTEDVFLDGMNIRMLLDKARVNTVNIINPLEHYVLTEKTDVREGNVTLTEFNFSGKLLYVSDFLSRKGDKALKIAHESEEQWTYLFQVVLSPENYEKNQSKDFDIPVVWDEKDSGEGFIPGSSGVELSLADPAGGPSYAAKVIVKHANWNATERP